MRKKEIKTAGAGNGLVKDIWSSNTLKRAYQRFKVLLDNNNTRLYQLPSLKLGKSLSNVVITTLGVNLPKTPRPELTFKS